MLTTIILKTSVCLHVIKVNVITNKERTGRIFIVIVSSIRVVRLLEQSPYWARGMAAAWYCVVESYKLSLFC